jgi:hypothetical protein
MFTKGQLVFAGFFVVIFITAIAFSYRKDKRLHAIFYPGGSRKILIGFLLFVVLLFVLKFVLKE